MNQSAFNPGAYEVSSVTIATSSVSFLLCFLRNLSSRVAAYARRSANESRCLSLLSRNCNANSPILTSSSSIIFNTSVYPLLKIQIAMYAAISTIVTPLDVVFWIDAPNHVIKTLIIILSKTLGGFTTQAFFK